MCIRDSVRGGRLAGPGTPRDDDVFPQLHGQANELRIFAPRFESEELLFAGVQLHTRVQALGEQAAGGKLLQSEEMCIRDSMD